jgi:hypothetical protein
MGIGSVSLVKRLGPASTHVFSGRGTSFKTQAYPWQLTEGSVRSCSESAGIWLFLGLNSWGCFTVGISLRFKFTRTTQLPLGKQISTLSTGWYSPRVSKTPRKRKLTLQSVGCAHARVCKTMASKQALRIIMHPLYRVSWHRLGSVLFAATPLAHFADWQRSIFLFFVQMLYAVNSCCECPLTSPPFSPEISAYQGSANPLPFCQRHVTDRGCFSNLNLQ